MYTILQDSNNNLQIPFKREYLYLLIVFTYRNKSVTAVFQNTGGENCDYEINIIEVGKDGTVDVNNGQIKLSPQSTWKAKIYGQDNNINLAPVNATLLYEYDFQVKGNSCIKYATEVKSCPDSRVIIENQDGDVLADETLLSGETEIIVIETGGIESLYAYPYASLNTGQDVSYAVGDDKWVMDNVFNPEIASWPTDRPWVFPVLNPTDPTLLLRGATPSGMNWFGNLNRFTDTLGGQTYDNDLVIDHYTGLMITKDAELISVNWVQFLNFHNDSNFWGHQDWHGGNNKEFTSLINISLTDILDYEPFNYNSSSNGGADTNNLWSSTTVAPPATVDAYQHLIDFAGSYGLVTRAKTNARRIGFSFRKAFTYDPLQDTTKLILS